MSETGILSARNVSKRVADGRSRREVLRDISLDVAKGELVLVRGASGSGKTTLLGILGGLLLPTSGEVWLEGEPISRLRDHQRAELRGRKVGYVFQDFGLVEGMSVLDNVLLPLVPRGHARRDLALAQQSIERLGIGPLAGANVSALSGGERQRVALARARVVKPPVLLLDEPTAHLDSELSRALLSDLIALREEGTAIVIASHDPRVGDDPRVSRYFELREGGLA